MNLEGSLAHLTADLDYLRHVAVGNHLNASLLYPCNTFDDRLDMRHVVSLDVQAAASFVTGKDRQDHEGLFTVQEIDSLSKQLYSQLPLLTSQTPDFPDLRV